VLLSIANRSRIWWIVAYLDLMSPTATPTGSTRRRRVTVVRDRVRSLPGGWLIWRIAVTIAGLVVIVIGAVLIPLPGPGWLIVFLGLGIWSTEYEWAHRLLVTARRLVGRWWDWMGRQPRWAQITVGVLGLAFTAAVSLGAWYLF
jgi:uncharacterized protein (TIGR02611 family)